MKQQEDVVTWQPTITSQQADSKWQQRQNGGNWKRETERQRATNQTAIDIWKTIMRIHRNGSDSWNLRQKQNRQHLENKQNQCEDQTILLTRYIALHIAKTTQGRNKKCTNPTEHHKNEAMFAKLGTWKNDCYTQYFSNPTYPRSTLWPENGTICRTAMLRKRTDFAMFRCCCDAAVLGGCYGKIVR